MQRYSGFHSLAAMLVYAAICDERHMPRKFRARSRQRLAPMKNAGQGMPGALYLLCADRVCTPRLPQDFSDAQGAQEILSGGPAYFGIIVISGGGLCAGAVDLPGPALLRGGAHGCGFQYDILHNL